jgi:ferredoxin-NADP reductase
MSMLRHRAAAGGRVPTRLLYSSRSLPDVIYRDELERLAADGSGLEVIHTLTRSQPPGWRGYDRRIDAQLVAEAAWPAGERPLAFVCGPTTFVEVAAQALAGVGYEPARIKTERFGPTGG